MDTEFWIKAWDDGRTNFHRPEVNEKLIEFFPLFKPSEGQKVLVPLCGKTKDLLWLQDLKLTVHGVELYEEPVKAFFQENELPAATITKDSNFTNYHSQNITISAGDFFKLDAFNKYDLIYDRASLVALPQEMRVKYAEVITRALKPSGKYLLISYEYDQSKLDGPPFSVDENEINSLYGKNFTIKLVDNKSAAESGRLATLAKLTQKVYILEKLSQ